ncbi:MAG: hypothetical protein ACE1ZA_08660 [Pseudomonadales bacterium]
MRTIIIFAALLLNGCAATTIYAGVGYDVGGSDITGVLDTDTSTIVFREEAWKNPVGVVGMRYPLGENFELDYRHISSLGSGDDIVNSDAISLLFKIGGSRQGWGLEPR